METIEEIGMEMATESLKYFITNLLYTIILAIGSIIVARLLGPEKYGQYSIALITPSILLLFTAFGIQQGLIRYTSVNIIKNIRLIPKYFKATLLFTAITGLIMTVIGYLFARQFSILLNRPELAQLIQIVSILVITQVILRTINSLLIGIGKAGTSGAIGLILAFTKTPSMIIFILMGLGVYGAVAGHLLGYLFVSIFGLIYVFLVILPKINGSFVDNNYNITYFSAIRDMLRYGLPLYISFILLSFSYQYLNINLTWYATNVEIGGYSAAVNISSAITLFVAPLSTVLFPSFSMIESKDMNALPAVFRRAIRITTLLIMPIAIYVSVYGDELMRVIYGSKYLFAGKYVTIYALLFLIQPIFMVVMSYFNGIGLTKETLKIHIIHFIIILIFTPILVAQLKVIGAITSLIIGYITSLTYGIYKCKKQKLSLEGKYILKLLFIFIIAITASSPIKMIMHETLIQIIFILLISGLTYIAVTLTIMGAVDTPTEQDIDFISRTLGGRPLIGYILNILIKYLKWTRKYIKK